MDEVTLVKKVSAETKSAITRKSAQTLPINPSERGYSAEEIKRRFYQPIIDAANSAIAEIDRVVDEVNTALGQVDGNLEDFIETSKIKEAYKLTLNKDTWVLNSQTNMYEVIISATTHGITNYKEVGVDMYLLDGDGNYISVNQYEIQSDATVRCFHENNGAGYLSIYVKREGFIIGTSVVDAEHVMGLAKVGLTNKYEDLDELPDLSTMYDNEEMISKIITGGQKVNSAKNADSAINSTYASTSGTADNATNADNADKAVADQYGVNISNGYCKQNGTYANLKAGKATLADTAKADEDGMNIKGNYAKQNGTYPSMTVGKATNADNAVNADVADKAVKDNNGAKISDTYATKTGVHPNMTVGKSENVSKYINGKEISAIFADDGITVNNAINAQFAKYASADIEKGTIEERLTRLGFKEGVVDITEIHQIGSLSISVNSLKKQGKYVLLEFRCEGTGGVIGKIPSDFAPKSDIYIWGHQDINNNADATFGMITSEGGFGIISADSAVFENIGWETK